MCRLKRNVAIYARVSTEHEAQLSALENQIQYYDNILAKHPDWVLYDKYIDEGITGTSTKKRKSFMRMLEDADRGYFDLIITREVSRFARNTVDTLQETRKLRRKGIEVWFTEDNIWTMNDEDGELRLTIMATLAQNESKKTSLRVKAGQMVSFQNAIPYGNGNILGYDRVGKEFVINKEQAKTVRKIYDLYLSGYGERAITYELEKLGMLTSTGKKKWHCSYIGRVLNNAFYSGTIVYRKEYVPDFLEQKKIKNYGEIEKVVVEGKHEPIITKEEFAEVQRIMASKRQPCNSNKSKAQGYHASDDIWVKKLECECGAHFNRKVWHRKDGVPQYSYMCYKQVRHGSYETRKRKGLSLDDVCTSEMVPRWKLDTIAKMVLELLFDDREKIVRIAEDLLERNIKEELEEYNGDVIEDVKNTINRHHQKLDYLLDLRLADEITKEQFASKKESLEKEIINMEEKLQELQSQKKLTAEDLEDRVTILKYGLENNFSFDLYSVPDSVIEALVDKVIIHKGHFEWYIKLFDDEPINCYVEGSKKKPLPSVLIDDEKKLFSSVSQHRQRSQK